MARLSREIRDRSIPNSYLPWNYHGNNKSQGRNWASRAARHADPPAGPPVGMAIRQSSKLS
ncbi:hypothetical protein CaCOL14_005116 [Colletotrichum acutatum]